MAPLDSLRFLRKQIASTGEELAKTKSYETALQLQTIQRLYEEERTAYAPRVINATDSSQEKVVELFSARA
jgi:hypothetical protein